MTDFKKQCNTPVKTQGNSSFVQLKLTGMGMRIRKSIYDGYKVDNKQQVIQKDDDNVRVEIKKRQRQTEITEYYC